MTASAHRAWPAWLFGLLLALLLGLARPAAAADAVYPQQTWQLAAEATSGWSAGKFEAADALARSLGTDAYLVVHRGVVVHQYGRVEQPINVASVRKSVLSLLYGIEVARGRIDLGRSLADLGIADKGGLSEVERRATVRELLQARSGVYHPAAYETADMAAQRPPRGSHAPGTFWYYNNWDFNALGSIFQKLTGDSVFAALDTQLARPLKFEDFQRERDTEFVFERSSEHPAYVMHLSARDLARIGLLVARQGRWQDRQIVPTQWVAESITSYSDAHKGIGYGYLWWVGQKGAHFRQTFPGPVVSARGHFGQFMVIDPLRDLVIVHRVNRARLFSREVGTGPFGDLLERILQAAPRGF